MMFESKWIYIGVFFLSLAIQFLVIRLSHRYHFFIDRHKTNEPQKFHTSATPRAGGIGIFLGAVFLATTPLGWKLIFSILLAFLSGIFEDFHRSIKPKTRLILQFVSAAAGIFLTHSIVSYLGMGIYLPYWLAVLFSIFSIVGLMNAVNIIDGFNGLASGITLLILFSFGITSRNVGEDELWHIIMIVAVAVIGFFLVNFPKGKIFLGDGGAYMLGFIVALIGIFLAGHYTAVSPWYILAVLVYPVWEVLFSIYRKIRAGRSPLEPDGYHMHMLIYKHITKNNPKTSLFILLGCSPFILLPTLYAHNSMANFVTVLLFVMCYVLLYNTLHKKETAAFTN